MDQQQKAKSDRFLIIRNIGIIVGVVTLFIALGGIFSDGPLSAGTTVPNLTIMPANGQGAPIRLNDLRGKVVLLDFWSTSCPPCLVEINILKEVAARFSDSELAVVGVAVGGESLMQLAAFSKSRAINYPIGPDPKGVAATAFHISTLPTMFIVDRNGKIVKNHVGFWPRSDLLARIKEVLTP